MNADTDRWTPDRLNRLARDLDEVADLAPAQNSECAKALRDAREVVTAISDFHSAQMTKAERKKHNARVRKWQQEHSR